MNDDREHKVRERAYALWESEGRPIGRHDDHWHQANSEFSNAAPSMPSDVGSDEARPAAAAKPKTSRRKPVAAGPSAQEIAVAQPATAPRKKRAVKLKAN